MNNKGETLVETLVAILIIALVITGFSNVVAGTIKTNKTIKEMRMTYDYDGAVSKDTSHTWAITISGKESGNAYSYNIDKISKYIDNELYYYAYE